MTFSSLQIRLMLLLFLSGIFITSCETKEAPPTPKILVNSLPGLASITITNSQTTRFVDLTITVTGGTPYNMVQCTYSITDYNSNITFQSLTFISSLDQNGSLTINPINVQCRKNLAPSPSSAFINWKCANYTYPYTQASVSSPQGNAFFFSCG